MSDSAAVGPAGEPTRLGPGRSHVLGVRLGNHPVNDGLGPVQREGFPALKRKMRHRPGVPTEADQTGVGNLVRRYTDEAAGGERIQLLQKANEELDLGRAREEL